MPTVQELNNQLNRETSRTKLCRNFIYSLLAIIFVGKVLIFPHIAIADGIIMMFMMHTTTILIVWCIACIERQSWLKYNNYIYLYFVKKVDGLITEYTKKEYEKQYAVDSEIMGHANLFIKICIGISLVISYTALYFIAVLLDSLFFVL